jgi:phosphoglycerate dehydrogenase-like enzyme
VRGVKVCLPFSPGLLDGVPDGFDVVVADATREWPADAAGAEIYVPAYRFDHRILTVMEQMPRLRVVQSLTAGVDHYPPLDPAVALCSGAGIHDAATSELAVGLMIAAQRDFAGLFAGMREGSWLPQGETSSLADQRVLIIGAGRIGRAIERRLSGFECSVTLVGRTARDDVRGFDELPALLPEADIVVLIVPLTDDTRSLVDKGFLASLHDDALLVNVARGAVVDTDALLAELSSGRLRAAVDVTDPEPLPADHPLWKAPGVIVSPHRGGASSAMWPRAYRLVSEQLRRLADGRPLLNVHSGPSRPFG